MHYQKIQNKLIERRFVFDVELAAHLTRQGYKLKETIDSIEEIDITYYWDTINTLLQKFTLGEWIKKKPPLTLLDKKQQSLMEWI